MDRCGVSSLADVDAVGDVLIAMRTTIANRSVRYRS